MNGPDSHSSSADLQKVVGIFAVVVLHSAAPLLYQYARIPTSAWWVANLYDSCARMAVPLFLMVSGSLILSKEYPDLKTFYARRCQKILVPLLFWSYFYEIEFGTSSATFLGSMLAPLAGPTYYHLGFLYYLVGLYLISPFLKHIVRHSTSGEIAVFLAIWFVAVVANPFCNKFFGVGLGLGFELVTSFMGYFILGYLISIMTIQRKLFLLAWGVYFLSAAITALGTYFLTSRLGSLDEYFYWYLSPTVLFMALSLFVILKFVSDNYFQKNSPTIRVISSCSFGVFLIHPAILYLINGPTGPIKLDGRTALATVLAVPVTAVLAVLVSTAATYVIRRIPYLRLIMP